MGCNGHGRVSKNAVMVNVWCWKWYDRLEDDGNRVHCKPKGGKEGGS